MLHEKQDRPDPETERKEIRSMLRLMRDNYERGMYEGEEYQYWQKVNGLKEKLELLNRIPETAIERAALTLLNLHDSWEWATHEERKMLVRTMIQEAGCDVGTKRIVWVKSMRTTRFLPSDGWTATRRHAALLDPRHSAEVDIVDIGEDMGQMATEVKIAFPMSGFRSSS